MNKNKEMQTYKNNQKFICKRIQTILPAEQNLAPHVAGKGIRVFIYEVKVSGVVGTCGEGSKFGVSKLSLSLCIFKTCT